MTQAISPAPVLEMRGIEKSYPGVRALAGVDLVVAPGEVHGLVGENGAGKSTIIKILAGLQGRDAGEITIDGVALDAVTPAEAHRAGIRFVHQELHLVPTMTVAENAFLGIEIAGVFGLRTRAMRRRTREVLRDVLGVDLSPSRLVRTLSPAERKLVQITRALVEEGARLVVFDEPTAPLGTEEAAHVLAAVARLRDRGISSLYVSHYLGEVTQLCDRVTVFRSGQDVGVLEDVAPTDAAELIRLMVGREIDELYPHRVPPANPPQLFEARGLSDDRHVLDASFTVGRGEIVGLTGLLGSGASEIIEHIAGLRRTDRRQMSLNGEPYRPSSPAAALDEAVALVPRDRRHEGLVLDFSVVRNLVLSTLRADSRAGLIDTGRSRSRADALIERLDIRPADPQALAGRLSGGNQQKVVLGRSLAAEATLLLLDEPTVGVDVGAKQEIYRLLDELAQEGAGVLVASTDPAEVLGLCDRILIMVRGRLVADEPTAGLELEDLIARMTGSDHDPRIEEVTS